MRLLVWTVDNENYSPVLPGKQIFDCSIHNMKPYVPEGWAMEKICSPHISGSYMGFSDIGKFMELLVKREDFTFEVDDLRIQVIW